jgi:hypothetical protein
MEIIAGGPGAQGALYNLWQSAAGTRPLYQSRVTVQREILMRPYRDIAALAGVQVFCFLLLSHLEPDFFLIHFYQTTIYLALLILLFYTEDRWAYMIGMLAPAAWLVMAFATGMLGAAVRQIFHAGQGAGLTNLISLLAGVTAIVSLLMIAACGRHWSKEYAGLGKSLSTFTVSLGIVAVYYAILVVWFWHLIPVSAAGN